MRWTSDQPVFNASNNLLEFRFTEESIDGDKFLLLRRFPPRPVVQVMLRDAQPLTVQTKANQKPLMQFLKPLDPEFGHIDPQRWQLEESQTSPGLLIVRLDSDGGRCIWVDPDRGYSIVRTGGVQDGWPTPECFIEHVHDTQHGWVPSRWQWTKTGGSGVYEIGHAEVTHYEINAPLPPDAFDVAIPPGARVHDLRTAKTP